MTAPHKLTGSDPEYTAAAIDHGVQGAMSVRCIVGLDGHVHHCRVVKGLPFMDRAVIEALEQRVYSPALLDGQPIEVDYTFDLRLTLPD